MVGKASSHGNLTFWMVLGMRKVVHATFLALDTGEPVNDSPVAICKYDFSAFLKILKLLFETVFWLTEIIRRNQ